MNQALCEKSYYSEQSLLEFEITNHLLRSYHLSSLVCAEVCDCESSSLSAIYFGELEECSHHAMLDELRSEFVHVPDAVLSQCITRAIDFSFGEAEKELSSLSDFLS